MKRIWAAALLLALCLSGCAKEKTPAAEPSPEAAPETSVPVVPEQPATETELSEEELVSSGYGFLTAVYGEENDFYLRCCFTSYYSDPADLNLKEYLRYFPTDETASEEEFRGLLTAGLLDEFVGSRWNTVNDLPVPIHRYPAEAVEASLRMFFGIGLADLSESALADTMYLPESKAFYNLTSDFGMGTFSPLDSSLEGDTVTLSSADTCLTLQRAGESWHISSFLPVTSEASAEEESEATETAAEHEHIYYRYPEYSYLFCEADVTLYNGIHGETSGSAKAGTRLRVLDEAVTAAGEYWLQVVNSSTQASAWILTDNVSIWVDSLSRKTRGPWTLPKDSVYYLCDAEDPSRTNTVTAEKERTAGKDLICTIDQRDGSYAHILISSGTEAWVLSGALVLPNENTDPRTSVMAEARVKAEEYAPVREWGAELLYRYTETGGMIYVYFPLSGCGDYVCTQFERRSSDDAAEWVYVAAEVIPEAEVPAFYTP